MAENAAGILGQFFRGYTEGRSAREAQKQQRVESLMGLARRYSEWADDPNADPEIQQHAAAQMRDTMMQAEKIQNEKAGGLTALMNLGKKIFGKGDKKGDPNFPGPMIAPQTLRSIYREAPEPTASYEAASPGSMPSTLPTPPAPNAAARQVTITGPGGQLTAQRVPEAAAQPITQPTVNLGGTVRQPVTEMVPMGTPGAYGTQPMINGVPINAVMQRRLALKQMEDDLSQQRAVSQAQAVGEINQRFSRDQESWKINQERQNRKIQADSFAASPMGRQIAAEDPARFTAMMADIQYGIPFREPTPMWDDVEQVDEQGNRSVQRMDLRTNRPVGPRQPKPPTAYDQQIRSYILSNRAKNYAEGERLWAAEVMNDQAVANARNKVLLDNSKQTLDARQAAQTYKKTYMSEGMTPQMARSAQRDAITWATNRVALEGEEANRIPFWEHFYVEQFIGMPYADLQKLMGVSPTNPNIKGDAAGQQIIQGGQSNPGATGQNKPGSPIRY